MDFRNPESLRTVLLAQMALSQVAKQKTPKYGTYLLSAVPTKEVKYKVNKNLCNRDYWYLKPKKAQ